MDKVDLGIILLVIACLIAVFIIWLYAESQGAICLANPWQYALNHSSGPIRTINQLNLTNITH